jgi:hypothetical protein
MRMMHALVKTRGERTVREEGKSETNVIENCKTPLITAWLVHGWTISIGVV